MNSKKIAKISIIVAVYNIEAYLPRCMESICGQTYENLEIILVDDGSTDTSPAICDSYGEKDSRILVIHKQNGGLSDARNAGMERMTGDFVGFVDGDDWIEPGMYDAMLKACIETKADIAVCRYDQIGENAVNLKGTGNVVPLTREEALDIYVCGHEQYLIYNSVWSKLFRRELIADFRFPVGKKSEDIMFTTKAFCRAEKLVYLDTPYYHYVLDRAGSIMNQKLGERRFQDEIPFWKEQKAYFYGLGMIQLSEKAAYHFYRRMLFYFIDFKDRKMKDRARCLIQMLRNERSEINRIYQKEYVAKGDQVRMRLALTMPGIYYLAVRLYDKLVIPFRQHH